MSKTKFVLTLLAVTFAAPLGLADTAPIPPIDTHRVSGN
jgi:hypothetical protein